MSTIDLYFTVMMKDGYVLYPTQGPFVTQEAADAIADADETKGRCYLGVVKVAMSCEVIERP